MSYLSDRREGLCPYCREVDTDLFKLWQLFIYYVYVMTIAAVQSSVYL